jgi:hypothetical protein
MKRKIPSHRRESNPSTPIPQTVAQRYTDWAKGKVKLSLCLTKYIKRNAMTYGGVELYLHALISALGGSGQLHAPAALPPRKSPRYPRDIRLGGGGPRAGLDAGAKRKKSLLLPGIEFWLSSPKLSHYTDWATKALPQPSCRLYCTVSLLNNATSSKKYSHRP